MIRDGARREPPEQNIRQNGIGKVLERTRPVPFQHQNAKVKTEAYDSGIRTQKGERAENRLGKDHRIWLPRLFSRTRAAAPTDMVRNAKEPPWLKTGRIDSLAGRLATTVSTALL